MFQMGDKKMSKMVQDDSNQLPCQMFCVKMNEKGTTMVSWTKLSKLRSQQSKSVGGSEKMKPRSDEEQIDVIHWTDACDSDDSDLNEKESGGFKIKMRKKK